MCAHARAVILLGGWLLMLPPSETKVVDGHIRTTVDTKAPTARWSQESAYDTAPACEAGKAGLANIVIPDHLLPAFVAAKCVPAEAVYPPKSPAQK